MFGLLGIEPQSPRTTDNCITIVLTNIKRGGIDYRPTHPEYNSKRGEGSQTVDPPTQAGAPTQTPPKVNLIPYKRSLHQRIL